MLRFIINTFFPSTFIFPDGSRVDYLIRDDCLRYTTAGTKGDVVEIALIYDAALKRSRIDESGVWRWKSNGVLLTEQERSEIMRKAKEFMARRPREFEVDKK
jgi:hypothetical protein